MYDDINTSRFMSENAWTRSPPSPRVRPCRRCLATGTRPGGIFPTRSLRWRWSTGSSSLVPTPIIQLSPREIEEPKANILNRIARQSSQRNIIIIDNVQIPGSNVLLLSVRGPYGLCNLATLFFVKNDGSFWTLVLKEDNF